MCPVGGDKEPIDAASAIGDTTELTFDDGAQTDGGLAIVLRVDGGDLTMKNNIRCGFSRRKFLKINDS